MVDVLLLEQQPMPAARMRIGLPEYPVGIAQGIEFGTRQARGEAVEIEEGALRRGEGALRHRPVSPMRPSLALAQNGPCRALSGLTEWLSKQMLRFRLLATEVAVRCEQANGTLERAGNEDGGPEA